MAKIKKRIKTIYIFIDGKREKIEDFIADNILKKIDENEYFDTLEEIVIIAAIDAAQAYLKSYDVPNIPEDVKKHISKSITKGLSKANKKLQNQLRKKSKTYKKNYGENKNDCIW